MRQDAQRHFASHRGVAALLAGVLTPPAAWLLHLEANFTIAQYVCTADGFRWLLHVTTVVALLFSVGAGLLAWRNWQDLDRQKSPDDSTITARSSFLAVAGLASAAFFSMAIIAAEIPTWFISPCA